MLLAFYITGLKHTYTHLTAIHFNSSISVEMFPILVWFYPYSAYCSIDIANLQPNLQHPCN